MSPSPKRIAFDDPAQGSREGPSGLARFAQRALAAQSSTELIDALQSYIDVALPGGSFALSSRALPESFGSRAANGGATRPSHHGTPQLALRLGPGRSPWGTLYIYGSGDNCSEDALACLSVAAHLFASAAGRLELQKAVRQQRLQYEAQRDAAIGAINHRVKNILASIGAIAVQSTRNNESLDSYVERLRGRIRALSNVHSILSATAGGAVPFEKLVREEFAAALDGDASRIALDGPTVLLKPRAGQILALALHELAANAIKFGALSTDAGSLSIRWRQEQPGCGPLCIEWIEVRPTIGASTPIRGFGLLVIEELLPEELDATVSYELGECGLRCSIVLPAEWVLESPA